MFRLAIFSILLTTCVMTGCQSARHISKDGETGVIAIPSNQSGWPFKYREGAEKLMTEHFPAGYEIVKEEEVVVGQTTNWSEDHRTTRDEDDDWPGIQQTSGSRSGSETTMDKTEYRIHYRRTSSE